MSNWKKGPLPANTYNWGGVVPVGENIKGFYFADFSGDFVTIIVSGQSRVLKADEVAWYNNSLDLPPQD